MDCQLIDNIEDFEKLKETWDSLHSQTRDQNIFTSWMWQYHWWKVFGNDQALRIILLKEEGQVFVIAPLYIQETKLLGLMRRRSIRFIGSSQVGSDYLNLIYKGESQKDCWVCLIDFLRKDRKWDLLDLTDISSEVFSDKFIEGTLFARYGKGILKDYTKCPVAKLPAKFEDYIAELSSSRRKDVRRKLRKMSKLEGFEFKIIETESELAEIQQEFIEINKERLADKGICGGFQRSEFRNFHLNIMSLAARQGILRLAIVKIKNELAGGLYIFRCGSSYLFYQSGMNAKWSGYSPLTVLFAKTIEQAILEKMEYFDFLQGDESYKVSWTHFIRINRRLLMANRHIKGVFHLIFYRIIFGIRNFLNKLKGQ